MRIVLLNERKSERDSMVRALKDYQVEAVADDSAAIAAIAREAPQVVVFSVPPKGGPDLARRLHDADGSGQGYLIAILEPTSSGREVSHLVDAGVMDFARRPVADLDLFERVSAPCRLLQWAQSVIQPAVFDFSGPVELTRLRSWESMGATVAQDLGQMAGAPLAAAKGWPAQFGKDIQSATLPMSLAAEQLEMRVSLVVDARTLRWIREILIGDPMAPKEATDDALRELTNTAAGALKRAAMNENIVLTTGLPVNDAIPVVKGTGQCWSMSLADDQGCIALVTEVRKRENQRVPASALIEGMVLARDIRNEGGILLVPAGSRLTGTSVARLVKMLGDRYMLEVTPAA